MRLAITLLACLGLLAPASADEFTIDANMALGEDLDIEKQAASEEQYVDAPVDLTSVGSEPWGDFFVQISTLKGRPASWLGFDFLISYQAEASQEYGSVSPHRGDGSTDEGSATAGHGGSIRRDQPGSVSFVLDQEAGERSSRRQRSAVVPEPATLAIMAVGLLALRRRSARS